MKILFKKNINFKIIIEIMNYKKILKFMQKIIIINKKMKSFFIHLKK